GLRARGGFEIVELSWKNGIIVKCVIKSTLGDNCRLRTPNALKLGETGVVLKPTTGKNTNWFYQTETIPKPIISPAFDVHPLPIKDTWLFDLDTKPGQTYTLIGQ